MYPGGGRKLARTGMRNKLFSLHGLKVLYYTVGYFEHSREIGFAWLENPLNVLFTYGLSTLLIQLWQLILCTASIFQAMTSS